MAKLFQTVLIFGVVAVALCHAIPAKLNRIRTTGNIFLARQEVSVEDIPAQTPYPPAGIRPEIPFDLPTEEKLVAPANQYLPPLTDPAMFYSAPVEFYGPPAKTYGPPEVSDEDEIEKSVPENKNNQDEETQTEEVQTEEAVTEETDSEQQQLDEGQQEPSEDSIVDIEASEVEEGNALPDRLVLTKSTSAIRAAKLKQFAPLTRKTNKVKQFYLINGSLYSVA